MNSIVTKLKINFPLQGLVFLIFIAVASCNKQMPISANSIVEKSIEAHGVQLLNDYSVFFQFRNYKYSVQRDTANYTYTRTTVKGTDTILDILDSGDGFKRIINKHTIVVPDSMVQRYSSSLNSVLYFFQLPYTLRDAAAIKSYKGLTEINNTEYHTIAVSFTEENGGEDFEDEFRYWINSSTYEIDYLAYSYISNGGGVRFRKAFNKKQISGMLFQDYKNYKPSSKETHLDSLPIIFEKEQLKLLSTIVNTEIQVLDIN